MARLLEEFVTQVPGYWREGGEEEFRWSATGGSVWYALLVVEDGRIQRYGFTSAASQKAELAAALRAIPSGTEALLLGVWTGEHKTSLFVLDRAKAVAKLSAL